MEHIMAWDSLGAPLYFNLSPQTPSSSIPSTKRSSSHTLRYQLTQRLIPLRNGPKLPTVLCHQQITHNPRKHNAAPLIHMRSIPSREIVLVRARRSNRVDIICGGLVQVDPMEIVRFSDSYGGRCFVGEVLDDTAVCERAPGEGRDEDGCCTCVDGFRCEEREVGFVVRGGYAAGGFLVVVAELFEISVGVRLHKELKSKIKEGIIPGWLRRLGRRLCEC